MKGPAYIHGSPSLSDFNTEHIYVTWPYMPPLEEFLPYLEQIWDSRILTNNGPFPKKFEKALCDYLGVEHLCLFTNGTIALVTALQTLRITGEVITTLFAGITATASFLKWAGVQPVFADIEPNTWCLAPDKILKKLPITTA